MGVVLVGGHWSCKRKMDLSSASVDNTLLDLQNSSYPTQPHSITANYYHYHFHFHLHHHHHLIIIKHLCVQLYYHVVEFRALTSKLSTSRSRATIVNE